MSVFVWKELSKLNEQICAYRMADFLLQMQLLSVGEDGLQSLELHR